jgi:hypothetical protein
LAKGERATIPLVAQDHRATKIAFSYIRDYLTGSPLGTGAARPLGLGNNAPGLHPRGARNSPSCGGEFGASFVPKCYQV